MQLAQWFSTKRSEGKTQAWLAGQVGVTPGRISQIVRDGTNSLELAFKIVEATAGEVSVAELRPVRHDEPAGAEHGATA